MAYVHIQSLSNQLSTWKNVCWRKYMLITFDSLKAYALDPDWFQPCVPCQPTWIKDASLLIRSAGISWKLKQKHLPSFENDDHKASICLCNFQCVKDLPWRTYTVTKINIVCYIFNIQSLNVGSCIDIPCAYDLRFGLNGNVGGMVSFYTRVIGR